MRRHPHGCGGTDSSARRRPLRCRLAPSGEPSEASARADEVGERSVTRIAILDRDATIVDVVRDEETGTVSVAFHREQLRFLSGAIEGMRALQDSGYLLCIATNQPGPAKGQFSAEAVSRTNEALIELLAYEGVRIAALEVCMHHPIGGPGGAPPLVQACDGPNTTPTMLTPPGD